MNILFYKWGAYTEKDISDFLVSKMIGLDEIAYYLKDKSSDEYFEKELLSKLNSARYDFVFSVNYFPVVARICYDKNIKYISWSYDNPLNVLNIEETLGYETNYVFMFDRMQAEKYIKQGFCNVYHLPLAVNVDRLIKVTKSSSTGYGCDISFVGNLYQSDLNTFMEPMSDYQRGYINGAIQAQQNLYGCYLIDDVISEKFVNDINAHYKKVQPDTKFVLPKEALTYAISAHITRTERMAILGILSKYYDVNLYSKEKVDLLDKVKFKGSCDYYNEMPQIFAGSRINLNMTLKILQSGIPLRALDIMGCGGFLLTNYQPEIAENFIDGEEVAMYESIEDAFEKARFYLANDNIRTRIARNGFEKVSSDYSYEKQFEVIFKIVDCV